MKPLLRRFTTFGSLAFCALVVQLPPQAKAALVGRWSFEGGNPLSDSTGYFSDLILKGNASTTGTALDVNGSGTSATGWAVTSGGYTGPTIRDKTLVSWIILQGLCTSACAGSALTIDRINTDEFDGIIFGEVTANKWMPGSTVFKRTQQFTPGVTESSSSLGSLLQLAITYQDLGNGSMRVSGYRNGTLMGQYTNTNQAVWTAGNTEVFFGLRHGTTSGGPGALNALIEEARIYNTALTQSEIQGLSLTTPAPAPLGVTGVACAYRFSRRMRARLKTKTRT